MPVFWAFRARTGKTAGEKPGTTNSEATMKRTTTTVAALAVASLFTACATTSQALIDEVIRTVPTCASPAECTAKWDAAQLWVARRAGWPLATTTNVVIQTTGPSTRTEDSTRLAVQVVREPLGGDRFRIVARAQCGNPFGCTPEIWPTLLHFNQTINAVQQ